MTYNQIIDSKIRDLELLKRMASDPAMRELMRQIVNSEPKPPSVAPKPEDGSGDLGIAVHTALAQLPGQYTYRDVIAEAQRDGYKFKAKNPRSAVTGILNKLVQRKQITLLAEGKGGQPSVYRNTKP